jgi:hypothetical protein
VTVAGARAICTANVSTPRGPVDQDLLPGWPALIAQAQQGGDGRRRTAAASS